jgi:hypothetical protein
MIHRLCAARAGSGARRRHRNGCRRRRDWLDGGTAVGRYRRGISRAAEMNWLFAREHVRRDHIVTAQRAAPYRIGSLSIAAGQRPCAAADQSSQQRINQLRGDIEHVGQERARAVADALPVDAALVVSASTPAINVEVRRCLVVILVILLPPTSVYDSTPLSPPRRPESVRADDERRVRGIQHLSIPASASRDTRGCRSSDTSRASAADRSRASH